jgi:integrase/recombinase XerC
MARRTRNTYLSDAELVAFMTAVRERRHVHQPRDHALFALLSNVGIRPSEALALTRADCHLAGTTPWLKITRLKKKRTAPVVDELQISPALAAIVSTHLDNVDPGGESKIFRISRRQAERLYHAYARIAGIKLRHWLYSLRHTAATRIYRATRDISIVQAILGHETADMSRLYVHIAKDMLAEAAAAHPAIV